MASEAMRERRAICDITLESRMGNIANMLLNIKIGYILNMMKLY